MSLRRSNRFKNKTFNYHATRIDTGPILPSKKNAQNEKNELYVFGHDDDMKMVENKSDAQEPNEESGSQPAIPDAQSFNLSGKIEKYYNFNWNSCKKLFGGVHAISRKAEDERPGYYHLCFVNMIQWSGNNRNITVNYKVKYSERLDDGSYAQYAAH
eukprot:123814_1